MYFSDVWLVFAGNPVDHEPRGREWLDNQSIIQQSQKGYIDNVIQCVDNGRPLLIENLLDDTDAVPDPVVVKMTMQHFVGKIGDSTWTTIATSVCNS